MIKCLACGSHMVEPLYSAGPQPLMALNLPKSQDEAKNATLYPMNFYMCCYCGHVYNSDFDYAKVPYKEDSNLMYNQGPRWVTHLNDLVEFLDYLANLLDGRHGLYENCVIDIGAGDGQFLNIIDSLSLLEGVDTRCIAFEPGIDSESCRMKGLEVYADYFIPQRDIRKFQPDFLTCRHVLEHLQSPRDFVAEIAYYANMEQVSPIFLAEVPCITKALDTCRITDFLYEHVSNFTQRSLRVMFENAGWETYAEFLAYDDEVAVWIGAPKLSYLSFESQAKTFRNNTWAAVTNVRHSLENRRTLGQRIAFWGGTGKSAAFLNAYHLNSDRVVDSDKRKVGRFVPGTAQEIEYADALLENPVDAIVITTRWRAADIYAEIRDKGIKYKELLVLDGTHLREYGEQDYVQEAKKE